MTDLLPLAPIAHPCAGCPTRLIGHTIACHRCEQRLPRNLPRNLRRALRQGARQRHRDHQPYLNALTAARTWWSLNRQET